MIPVTFIALAGAALVVLLVGSSLRARGLGEGSRMRRFVLIALLIGVVFALNVGIHIPHPVRHHRTLLPPKPVPTPPVVQGPNWIEVQTTDEDDPPAKKVVAAKSSRTRDRGT